MTKNYIKILSTLALAASDEREDTLRSVILRTVEVNKKVQREKLSELIEREFDFKPFESEIEPLVASLIDADVLAANSNMIQLTESQIQKLKEAEVHARDEDKERFNNFKNFILADIDENVTQKQILLMWSVFLEYIYNSFYEYGYSALKTLHPNIKNDENNGKYEDELKVAFSKLKSSDPTLVPIFKQAVEKFPDYASAKDLEFLNALAQKTLSFTSLGIRPELAFESIDYKLIDWIVYLDTNVLYSILNLHSHPENEACLALINLVKENQDQLKIKFRYAEHTYSELKLKRNDFASLDEKLSDSSIRALLRSEKLDSFSQNYYQSLIKNRELTVHPNTIIKYSQSTLESDHILVGRTNSRLEHIGEDYLESRVTDYYKFIEDKNRVKETFNFQKGIPFNPVEKSEKQVYHDVALRELILSSRKVKPGTQLTLNSIKYFGLTLDGFLLAYDQSKVKDDNSVRSYPVFFKPSFLLNKLVKVLPIRTSDYKKAFIKAITTKGFHRNKRKSDDILRIVTYLKSKGIDNEQVIFNMISEDIFLDKFRENSTSDEFDLGDFIDSELNREFKQLESELKKAEQKIVESENVKDKIQKESTTIQTRKEYLELELEQYKNALLKISQRVKSLENSPNPMIKQTNLDFEGESIKQENKKIYELNKALESSLKSEIEDQIEKYLDQQVRNWQLRSLWNLFWAIPAAYIAFSLIFPDLPLGIIGHFGNSNVIAGFMGLILDLVFGFIIKQRFFNERELKAKRENLKIPKELTDKLKKFNND